MNNCSLYIVFKTTRENLKHGIKSGMIKARSACEAGEKAYKDANHDLFSKCLRTGESRGQSSSETQCFPPKTKGLKQTDQLEGHKD